MSGQRRPDDFQILAKLVAGKLILCIRNPSLLNFLQHFFQVVPVCPGLGQSQKAAEKKFDEPTSLRNSRLARVGDRGTGTTGKGLVQLVVPLPDGGELLMSWSRLVMPAGWPLQGVGVLPGLCTAEGGEAAALGLAALRAGARPMSVAQRRQRALRHPAPTAEAEAIRAACPAGDAREGDLALARALALDPVALAAAMAR